ncbi:MAG: hypothetical protein LUG57_05825, partial [Oscillospiraceae bacterium]|nr:hypothetical protein [Oscillospiraceae bacterium]
GCSPIAIAWTAAHTPPTPTPTAAAPATPEPPAAAAATTTPEPTATAAANPASTAPSTGDECSPLLWAALLLTSCAALVLLASRKRKT